MLFSLVGDALWIIALSIMASATRMAWGRMTPETKVPLQDRKSTRLNSSH